LTRLKELEKELAKFPRKIRNWNYIGENEKDVIDQIKECTKKIDELRNEAEQAERVGNYQRVAEINYGLIPELQKKIEKAQTKLAVLQKIVRC
jgi:ATP-dependent Clp protease ATP-binding subunit ClpB